MKNIFYLLFLTISITLLLSAIIRPQADTILVKKLDSLLNYNENLEHRLDILEKNIDDLM